MPSQIVTDTVGTIHGLASIWGWLAEDVGEEVFASGTPSALDLAGDTIEVLRSVVAGATGPPVTSGAEAVAAIGLIAPFAAAAVNRAAGDRAARQLLVALTELFHRAGRAVHGAGGAVPSHHGEVVRVNASDGGVPKRSIGRAEVDRNGLVADRQANRRHHGKPMQALCLYSQEVIDALRSEGHPISPGAAGENLTLRGIDWSALRPGVRLRVGTVLAEISAAATPCHKNAQWFLGGDYDRMHQDRHPGWSRLYAWVLTPGEVREGDEVVVEPGAWTEARHLVRPDGTPA